MPTPKLPSPRQIYIHPVVEDFLKKEIEKYVRLENILNGVLWLIARDPDVGEPCNYNPPKYLIKKQFGLPVPRDLLLLYSYSDSTVEIEFARIAEPSD